MENTIYCTIIEEENICCSLVEDEIKVTLNNFGSTIEKIWELLEDYLILKDLTSEIDGIKTDFEIDDNFYSNSLKVWINGIKERGILVLSDNSFRVTPVLEIGDSLEIEYIKKL